MLRLSVGVGRVAGENTIPLAGAPLPAPVRGVRTKAVSFTHPGADGPSLKGVGVCVPRGKVTALVGANGSGKTTLTKVLAGLLLPAGGDGWWAGESGGRVELREADRAQVLAEVGWLAPDFPRWEMAGAANAAIGVGDRPRNTACVRKAAGEAGVLGAAGLRCSPPPRPPGHRPRFRTGHPGRRHHPRGRGCSWLDGQRLLTVALAS
ncbi:ATP-binding cassette domain-containing protein [Streptomyces sp. NPDC096136]|uniref:ATP-binding cassette domain-containing protein n=1 Tax=Streptomyces sp. NPDC096136 TaxID=3366076 RepID=UPI00381A28ED